MTKPEVCAVELLSGIQARAKKAKNKKQKKHT
jgi:hypothetical protein